MSARQWKRGTVAKVQAHIGPRTASRSMRLAQALRDRGMDPGTAKGAATYDWEAVRVDNVQAALRSLVEPEPEVYQHFVQSGGAVKRSLCGKVFWEPDERSVSMGKCPECAALVEAGWIK